jgi:uncharacterized membrane protein YqjE
MAADPGKTPGLFGSVRRLGATLFALGQTRLSLACVDLSEERDRILKLALFTLVGAFASALALVALSALLVVAFWDSARLQVLGLLLVVYLVIALWCASRVRALGRDAPALLESTLAELERDAQALRRAD